VPLEWESDVFDAIRAAIAHRITVIEPAGNGGNDLDQAGCLGRFDRTVRDSGAIMVGAGHAGHFQHPLVHPLDPPLSRLDFSNYGGRVDVQAYGELAVAAGYGLSGGGYYDAADPFNADKWYNFFSGTSSASPIVAGAVAILQGIAIEMYKTPLLPMQIREVSDKGLPFFLT